MAESVSGGGLGADGLAFDDGERGAERASGGGGGVHGYLGAAEDYRGGFEADGADEAALLKRMWIIQERFGRGPPIELRQKQQVSTASRS